MEKKLNLSQIKDGNITVIDLLRMRRKCQLRSIRNKLSEIAKDQGAIGAVVLDWEKNYLTTCPPLIVVGCSQTAIKDQFFSQQINGREVKVVFLKKCEEDLEIIVDSCNSSLQDFLEARPVVTVMDFRDKILHHKVACSNAKVVSEGPIWLVGKFSLLKEGGVEITRYNLIIHYLPKGRSKILFQDAVKRAKQDWLTEWRSIPKCLRNPKERTESWLRWKKQNLHKYWPSAHQIENDDNPRV